MAWKYGDIYLKVGKSWTETNGTMHPAQWMRWTDSEKKAKGLTWEDDVDTSYDNRFYSAKDVERKLADELAVDEDGNALIDPFTGKQTVTLGLKSIWIEKIKTFTNEKLSVSDWEITRKAEKGTAIASATTTYRDKVRTACNTIETKINNCADLDAFKALFDVPTDSGGNITGNAPMYDFPDEI